MSEDAPRDVVITHEPVELYKVLKFEGLVGSGGEAKAAIDRGEVSVDGRVEQRRRRKLVDGVRMRLRHVPAAGAGTP